MVTYSVVMVTVTMLCVVLSVWYSVRTRHVITQLETASREILDKSAAVNKYTQICYHWGPLTLTARHIQTSLSTGR